MSKSSQPSEHSPKDPVRIVYHAGNRTFARLFNERSLEEVKDVVRRKLGLGPESTVTLKQMIGSVDLEDDGDFQAFRVLLRSCVSVDIQVTVGQPQGSTVLPPPKEPSASEPATTSLASSSRGPAGVAASDEPNAPPKVRRTVESSTTTPKKAEPSARKRKVSFGDALAGSDKPAEQHAPTKSAAASPVASTKTAGSPGAPKPAGEEVSLPKKRKKDPAGTKGVETTGVVESPATKASGTPKPRPKRSTALGRGSKAVTKDDETSEPPAKKQKQLKKDDSTSQKSSAPIDQDGTDQPISQPIIPVHEASPQPAAAIPTGSGAGDGTSKTRKPRPPRGTVCAS
ncbi:hypothetical protein HD554DRAFT_1653017 [Boletus coccyginus]|nr:hypothetical protein HD554DRAFT_1653017 [Boletus coccyginus]